MTKANLTEADAVDGRVPPADVAEAGTAGSDVADTTPIDIVVAGLPDAPGLRVRRYVGPTDHAGMAVANTAWRASIGLEQAVSTEVIDNLYAHLTGSDPYRDCLVLEADGRIRGYTRTEWQQEPGGDRIYETAMVLDPSIATEAAYTALLAHGHRHLARQHADRTARPGDRHRGWLHDADTIQVAAHAGAGFRAAHHWYEMVRPTLEDLPDLPLPDGLEIRPVEPDHWRAIWEADIEAFSDDWDAPDLSETAFQRFLGEPDQVPELWQVAWDGDQVAGYVLVTIDAESNARFGLRRAELDSIAVRAPWRRRGLARALIARALAALRDHGETSASLGVDVDNPNQALTLYESCGFVVRVSGTVYERPFGATA